MTRCGASQTRIGIAGLSGTRVYISKKFRVILLLLLLLLFSSIAYDCKDTDRI